MSKFDRVLSDAELISATFKAEVEGMMGELRAVEQAALAKLAEREPSAPDGFRLVNEEELIELSDSILGNYYRGQDWERGRITNILKAAPCVSPTSDKAACVSESGESETQTNSQGLLDSSITPLAQRKIQTLLDKGEYRAIENATVLVNENGHAAIVNRGGAFYWVDNEALAREFDAAEEGSKESDKQCKMVWCACGDGFEADTFGAGFIAARGHCQGCDAEDRSSLLAESKAKIMAAADWLSDVCVMEIRGTETDKDVAEAYKALEMRVAAELAIAQERANKEPEGWQLVRVDPSEVQCLLIAKECGFEARHSSRVWAELLAAAPKYTGEK